MPQREVPELELQGARRWITSASGRPDRRAARSRPRWASSAFCAHLLKDPEIGKLIVPIVPDEGRTFGLESAIRQVGIYASEGQKYKPHDVDMLLYYREEQDGQILEEGITEAGRWPRSPRRAPPTRTTACRRFPSTCTTRCSDSSASAT